MKFVWTPSATAQSARNTACSTTAFTESTAVVHF
jgi:hypothetical protein